MAKPEKQYRVGSVSGATFCNDTDQGKYRTTKITRRYKDDDGKWQDGNSYDFVQLLQLREIVNDAIAYHKEQQAAE